jgi:hypothetical protein
VKFLKVEVNTAVVCSTTAWHLIDSFGEIIEAIRKELGDSEHDIRGEVRHDCAEVKDGVARSERPLQVFAVEGVRQAYRGQGHIVTIRSNS